MSSWDVGGNAKFTKAENSSQGSQVTLSDEDAVAKAQEEHRLKLEKRRQAKRESAKRSKKRKQEECLRLQARVEKLTADRSALTQKLIELSEECEMLNRENKSIMKELRQMYGPDVVSLVTASLADKYPDLVSDSFSDE